MRITVPIRINDHGSQEPDFDGGWAQPVYHDDGTVTITVTSMPPGWTPPGRLTKLAYSLRFTQAERIAIRQREGV